METPSIEEVRKIVDSIFKKNYGHLSSFETEVNMGFVIPDDRYRFGFLRDVMHRFGVQFHTFSCRTTFQVAHLARRELYFREKSKQDASTQLDVK